MKTSGTCPKCACRRVYVVDEVRHPDSESLNGTHALHVATPSLPARRFGLTNGNDHRTHAGRFEAWICSRCGLTEWYARDPEGALEKLSHHPHSGVRVVEMPSGGGPLR